MGFSKRKSEYPDELIPIYEYFLKNRNNFPSFREAITYEKELIEENSNIEPAILRKGIYVKQIKTYNKYFDKNQIFIIGFKDLIKDSEKTLYSIYNYLDITNYPFEYINKEIKNKTYYKKQLNTLDKKYLENFYKDYNEQLFNLINKKINW